MNLIWPIILVLVVFSLIGAPGVAWNHGYGYYPSGGLGLVVIILVVLLLMGRL